MTWRAIRDQECCAESQEEPFGIYHSCRCEALYVIGALLWMKYVRSHGETMKNGAAMNIGATTNQEATRIHGATRNCGGAALNSVPDITEGGYAIVQVTTYARRVLSTNFTLLYDTEGGYIIVKVTTYARGVLSTNYTVPHSTEGSHATGHATSTPAHYLHRTILRRRQQISRSRRYGVEEYYAY